MDKKSLMIFTMYEPHAMGSLENGAQKCYKSYLYSLPDDVLAELTKFRGKFVADKFRDLVLTIRVSSNILEGSTGCYVWPAGIFLSEFILANPAVFSDRSCLEIGAGAGLSSICVALLNASKVIATDGNPSVLDNLKHNFALNGVTLDEQHKGSTVECQELLWESASEDVVAGFSADIVIGADIIYDPSCIPALVQLLVWLLSRGCKHGGRHCEKEVPLAAHGYVHSAEKGSHMGHCPVAFLVSAIRNKDTMFMFISSAGLAGLKVEDVTEAMRPPVLLPQVTEVDRSAIHLHRLTMK